MICKACQVLTVDEDKSIVLIARIQAPDDANWFRVERHASDLAVEAYRVLKEHYANWRKTQDCT